MAKKILAIFFVSILLCSYIIPTTSAFADVVIGDNDSYAVTELGVENGKKIATMEAILQLLESGVSEINFNDISDLEDYLDNFYDELTNVNYQDVSNEILAGAYNDVKELKQWIDDRGEFIATYYKDYLNSADQGLSNIFNQFQIKIPKSKLVGTSLNGFRGLSRFNRGEPAPNPDPNYLSYINKMNNLQDNGFFWKNYNLVQKNHSYIGGDNVTNLDYSLHSWFSCDSNGNFNSSNPTTISITNKSLANYVFCTQSVCTLYINNTGSTYIGRIDSINSYYVGQSEWGYPYYNFIITPRNGDNQYFTYNKTSPIFNSTVSVSYSGNLQQVFNYFSEKCRNVNIYVDGNPWSIVGGVVNNPTLDIDGIIKLYGNDNPIQYEFPQGTQIDYNALYTTIYNAIRDNLPLDMQTINNNQVYYDSHDTVYSPTIYNYYGKDGDDENDWIDSILDYATIPDFNSALSTVAVLDTPFVNGITIVNAGVTDVIPSDILLIFGGFFVLVLFVCIINRMSE